MDIDFTEYQYGVLAAVLIIGLVAGFGINEATSPAPQDTPDDESNNFLPQDTSGEDDSPTETEWVSNGEQNMEVIGYLESHENSITVDSEFCKAVSSDYIADSDRVQVTSVDVSSDIFAEKRYYASDGSVEEISATEDKTVGDDPLKVGLDVTCTGSDKEVVE
jgi:hypothetical protein